jgi:hypothetical protein
MGMKMDRPSLKFTPDDFFYRNFIDEYDAYWKLGREWECVKCILKANETCEKVIYPSR